MSFVVPELSLHSTYRQDASSRKPQVGVLHARDRVSAPLSASSPCSQEGTHNLVFKPVSKDGRSSSACPSRVSACRTHAAVSARPFPHARCPRYAHPGS